jgi:hypothetical protein
MFCAPGLIFGGIEGVGSSFHVLRSRTHFRRFRGRRVQFSCFALPNSFSAVPRVLGPVFMFCAPGLVFGGTKSVRSRFHVVCSRTRFRRYRGRRVPFSCFALPNSFSAVPTTSCDIFKFCAPGHIFGGSEGVMYSFDVLRSRTRFRRYRGRRVMFSCCVLRTRFRRYRGRRLPLSCFALPDTFPTVRKASGLVFMFLLLNTFRRWGGRRVPFSFFSAPAHVFGGAVPRASGPVCKFCAPGLIFGGTGGVGSCSHVLRSWTHF